MWHFHEMFVRYACIVHIHIFQAARHAVMSHGKAAKQLVAEAEAAKKTAAYKEKFEAKVDHIWN